MLLLFVVSFDEGQASASVGFKTSINMHGGGTIGGGLCLSFRAK